MDGKPNNVKQTNSAASNRKWLTR